MNPPAAMQWDQASYNNQYDFPLTNSYHEAEHFAAQGMPPPGMGYGDQSMESFGTSRSRKLSSQGRKALNWIKGKRSHSPMNNSTDMQPSSPSSFVVRTVSRSPGGVSQDSYMAAGDQSYQPQRSQPVQPMSLGVPPGGPGGGTGYGTAFSSNDGRPEHMPFDRYESGGRPRQNSHSSQRSSRFDRSASPTRPASPGAIKAGAFHAPSRISPGPVSNRQRVERDDIRSQKSFEQMRDATLQRRVSAQSLWMQHHPEQQQRRQQMEGERRAQTERQDASHRPVSQAPIAFPRDMSAGQMSSSQSGSNRFSMPVHIPHGTGPPPVIPLDGVYPGMRNGSSQLGSVSPMPSPMARERERLDSNASQSPATTANKWFKGIFGRSPRHDEREDYMYRDMPWASSGGDTFPAQRKTSQRRSSAFNDGSPITNRRFKDPAELEAEAQKRQSMMMAAKIEDEHRNRVINGDSRQGDNHHRQERSQLVAAPTPSAIRQQGQSSGRAEIRQENWDPPRSRSPPGRKPAPQVTDGLSALESTLTPAQQIIAETRSKIRERERRDSEIKDAPREQSWMNSQTPEKGKERATPISTATQGEKKPRKSSNMKPGEGPMPSEMPLPEAMQEMMARFYRFERYVIPLVRSLESRVGDIERDNEISQRQQGSRANGQRDRDMEKWVSQMTSMMKGEIGQLQLAARDIRKAREAITVAAQEHASAMSAQAAESQALTEAAQGLTAPVATSTASASMKEPKATSTASASMKEPARLNRENNKPREETEAAVEEVPRKHSKVASYQAEAAKLQDCTLGEEIAKDDERKKSNFSSASFQSALPSKLLNEGSTERSASPSGRTRYTHALGQPLQDGKLTPQPSPGQENSSFTLPPLDLEKGSQGSTSSPHKSPEPGFKAPRKNTLSVDERLRGLVSRSASAASHELQAPEAEESQSTSRQREESAASKASNGSSPWSNTPKTGALQPEKVSFPRALSPASPKVPSPVIPQTTGESIRTSSNASKDLRARAQSYLQQTASATSSPSNSPGLNSKPFEKPFGAVRTPLFQSASPASGHVAGRRSASGSSVLKATGILGSRDLNAGGAFAAHNLAGSRAFTKSATSTPPPKSSILDALPTSTTSRLSKSALSSPDPAAAPNPQRMSIRDRVAFFDSQMG